MEAFLAALIGFLIGRGVEPKDAASVVEALRTYLGFEPPLGLTGYALEDIAAGQTAKTSVVVRGKTYDVVALDAIPKYSQVSVLGKKGDVLEVTPTIESLMLIREVRLIQDKSAIEGTDVDVFGTADVPPIEDTLLIDYYVPAGKTLFIYDWSVGLRLGIGNVHGCLFNAWDEFYMSVGGGAKGFQTPFSKPKRLEAGKNVRLWANHQEATSSIMIGHFGGILI